MRLALPLLLLVVSIPSTALACRDRDQGNSSEALRGLESMDLRFGVQGLPSGSLDSGQRSRLIAMATDLLESGGIDLRTRNVDPVLTISVVGRAPASEEACDDVLLIDVRIYLRETVTSHRGSAPFRATTYEERVSRSVPLDRALQFIENTIAGGVGRFVRNLQGANCVAAP